MRPRAHTRVDTSTAQLGARSTIGEGDASGVHPLSLSSLWVSVHRCASERAWVETAFMADYGNQTALIVVDGQNDFADPAGSFRRQ